MEEFIRVRQDPGSFKRYFCDTLFDCFIWYDRMGGSVTGFQLVYDKNTSPKSLTWINGKGFRHNKLDPVERSVSNLSPILVPDGAFHKEQVSALFLEHSKGMEEDIVKMIVDAIIRYDPSLNDQLV